MKKILFAIIIGLVVSLFTHRPNEIIYGCLPPGGVAPRYTTYHNQYGQLRWTHKIITYSFTNVPDFAKKSFASDFGQWSQAVGCLLEFQESTDPNANINITWDSDNTLNTIFLGYTALSTETNSATITSARIVINANTYDWHSGEPRGVSAPGPDGKRGADIDGVALHEIGHALGMDHSDDDPSKIVDPDSGTPTMNSIIFPGAEKLHPDDIAGILNIYSDITSNIANDFQNVEIALTNARILHNVSLAPRIPRQLKNKTLKTILIGTTNLYFDTTTGEYLGQVTRNHRFQLK